MVCTHALANSTALQVLPDGFAAYEIKLLSGGKSHEACSILEAACYATDSAGQMVALLLR